MINIFNYCYSLFKLTGKRSVLQLVIESFLRRKQNSCHFLPRWALLNFISFYVYMRDQNIQTGLGSQNMK